MATDYELRVHRDWIGLLQPVGLVVSPPALRNAQAFPDKNILKEQQALLALITPPALKDGAKAAPERPSLPLRFEALATDPSPAWKRYAYLRGVLTRFDLPELFLRRRDKAFLLLNPCDAQKKRLDEVAALRLYGMDEPHTTVHVDDGPANNLRTIAEWLQGGA